MSVEIDNPRTHITCIAGAGPMIVTPNFLLEHRPDVVTVMSPMYREEIASELAAMDSSAELVMVKRSQEKAAACPAAGL